MRPRDAIAQARHRLQAAGVEDSDFEAEYLLRHALAWTRETLLLRPEHELSIEESCRYEAAVERRAAGEPSAYIIGRREFYGLDLRVDPRALIPRPETEMLVELTLAAAHAMSPGGNGLRIAEVGVGCGAVSVALGVHLPGARIWGTDLSPDAVELAKENAAAHGVAGRVTMVESDLLDAVPGPFDIIVSNPPYVPTPEIEELAKEIREHEPRVALDGGPDGSSIIARLLQASKDKLRPGGAMFMEMGWNHGERAAAIARKLWPEAEVSVSQDLAGLDRALTVRVTATVATPALTQT